MIVKPVCTIAAIENALVSDRDHFWELQTGLSRCV